MGEGVLIELELIGEIKVRYLILGSPSKGSSLIIWMSVASLKSNTYSILLLYYYFFYQF